MTRPRKILLFTGGGILLLLLLIVIALLTFDFNRIKPYINRRVSEATGRVFEIRGDLRLDWRRSADEGGWHAWIPWPRPSAQDVVMSNPDWAKTGPQMLNLKRVAVSFNPWPLLGRRLVLQDLDVDGLLLNLERTTDARNNWTFKKPEEPAPPSAWDVDLGKVAVRNAALRYLDPNSKLDLKADAHTMDGVDPKGYGLQFTAGGSYRHAPITGSGKTGSILSLKDKHAVFPVQGDLHIGKNAIALGQPLRHPLLLQVRAWRGGTRNDGYLICIAPDRRDCRCCNGVFAQTAKLKRVGADRSHSRTKRRQRLQAICQLGFEKHHHQRRNSEHA